jgi:hypothetical protein
MGSQHCTADLPNYTVIRFEMFVYVYISRTPCQHIPVGCEILIHMYHPYIPSPITPASSLPASKASAPLLEPPIRQRLRENTVVQQLEHVPLASTALSLEVPKDPAARLGLVRVKLYLNVATNLVLPVLGPRRDGSRFTGARANVVRAWVASFHAGASIEAVEMRRTVGEGTGPFADNCVEVSTGVSCSLERNVTYWSTCRSRRSY